MDEDVEASRRGVSPVSPNSDGGGGSASYNVQRPVLKVHILPFVEADQPCGTSLARLRAIAPALRRRRENGDIVRSGDVVSHDGLDYAVIKCDPQEGPLSAHTDYYLEGCPLVRFEKIQFNAWGPTEMSSDDVFSKYVVPNFEHDFAPYGTPGASRVRFFYVGMVLQVGDVYLQVEATEPAGLGIVAVNTEIFAVWEKPVEFEKVHIVPFQDTVPRAYEFDIFQDYLKPYLTRNPFKKFLLNELFSYQGIQFKVVACEPSSSHALIGKSTTIYCEGVIPPSLGNLLSQEELSLVSQMPPSMQLMVLSQARSSREAEEASMQRRGLFEETITAVEEFVWPPSTATEQSKCMVCLMEFQDGVKCRRLPCAHVFHKRCVDEWLRRCTDCPICKDNVDRAIRQY